MDDVKSLPADNCSQTADVLLANVENTREIRWFMTLSEAPLISIDIDKARKATGD